MLFGRDLCVTSNTGGLKGYVRCFSVIHIAEVDDKRSEIYISLYDKFGLA